MEISGRQFPKKAERIAGGAARGTVAVKGVAAGQSRAPSRQKVIRPRIAKQAVRFNGKVCDFCMVCGAICSMRAWDGQSNPQLGAIRISFDNMYGEILDSRICRQCAAPSCMQACAKKAITIDKTTGASIIDRDKCTGCRLCEKACPFGAVVYSKAAKKCFKCDLCNGEPLCVKHCPSGALTLGGGA